MKESFDTNSITVLTTSPNNFNIWATSNVWNTTSIDNNISKWSSTIKQIPSQYTNQNTLLLCDPLDADNYLSNNQIYQMSSSQIDVPPGFFISIMNPEIRKHIDVPYNFENKTIGYIDISDYYFIQAIINSYKMDSSTIKLIQLQKDDIQDLLTVINVNKIDILIVYLIINSDMYNYIINQRISIVGFTNLNFDRIKVYYPYVSPQKVKLQNIFTYIPSNKLLIPERDNKSILPKMTMKLINIGNNQNAASSPSPSIIFTPVSSPSSSIMVAPAPSPSIIFTPATSPSPVNINTFETFITRLSLDPENTSAYYRCFGNPYSESKAECESLYDIYGNPQVPIKWDKLCFSNEECPFYKKNTNYSNERGGCLNSGLCEMPIGVLQASPRKYFDTGKFKPFCYGCSSNIDCCDITNDYAFVNDTDDRIAAGLKTSIPFM